MELSIEVYEKALRNGKLLGSKCKRCGEIYFPLRPVCPKCGSNDMEIIESSGKGRIRSFTVIYVAPAGFIEIAPYIVGIVDLDEGASIMGRILGGDPANPEKLQIGTRVKFEPLTEKGKVVAAFKVIENS